MLDDEQVIKRFAKNKKRFTDVVNQNSTTHGKPHVLIPDIELDVTTSAAFNWLLIRPGQKEPSGYLRAIPMMTGDLIITHCVGRTIWAMSTLFQNLVEFLLDSGENIGIDRLLSEVHRDNHRVLLALKRVARTMYQGEVLFPIIRSEHILLEWELE